MGKKSLGIYALAYILFLYLPVLLIPIFSFNASPIVSFPIEELTTRWYKNLFGEAVLHSALQNSLKVGVVAALTSTLLGMLAARAITNYNFFGRTPITALIMSPLVLPEIIVGISLLILLQQLGLNLSLFTVALGHVLLCLPFAIIVLRSSFEGLDKSLEYAAQDLGETPFWVFLRVTFPLILPSVLASLLITFTISFDEFLIAFFLTGNEPTLPVYIWSQLRFIAKLPNILALGSLILLFSFLLLWGADLLRRHAEKRTQMAK